MLVEVALDVEERLDKGDNHRKESKTKKTGSANAAKEFLDEFPTAKIVVVIDTHSAESGFLLWRGQQRGEFETSPLFPVSVNPLLICSLSQSSRS